ncbi:MAG TPA: phosphotransferase [Ktedonobacterales bacterium]
MSVPVSSSRNSENVESQVYCPLCGQALETLVVNPTGELIGCEDCAEERGLAGDLMTVEEWNSPTVLPAVLDAFAIADWQARKPEATASEQPRAHYWEVLAGGARYFLKRFYPWYPSDAIRYVHSVMTQLARQGVSVPQPVLVGQGGDTFAEVGGARWALYRALDGHTATRQEWMWGRPKAAEMLATLHLKLEGFTPQGTEFQPWSAWTLDTVDSVLESWQPHPELSPDLLRHVRDRLATRYFDELYPALPKLVVHGDYVANNVLWRGDSISASVSGVLDFEKAHLDTALFDFAWGLGDRRPPLLRATIATYSRVRPLSALEREAMPEALLLGALMGIDMQMTYFNNMEEVSRLAQDLTLMVRDLESLRKAAALK